MNRRIQVEFWYDDPLAGIIRRAAALSRRYGRNGDQNLRSRHGVTSPRYQLENGQPIVPPDLAANLRRALTEILTAQMRGCGLLDTPRTKSRPPHRIRVWRRYWPFRGARPPRHGYADEGPAWQAHAQNTKDAATSNLMTS